MLKKGSLFLSPPSSKVVNSFNYFRYFLYRTLDVKSNKHRFSILFLISILYNTIFFLIPLTAIIPMILNYVTIDGMTDWDKVAPVGSHVYNQLGLFNHQMGIFFLVEYIFLYFMLVDFIIRWFIVDYKYANINTVSRYKLFIKYPFRISNFYEIAAFVILITLYSIYGHFSNGEYIINIGAFATIINLENATQVQKIAQTWLKAEMIYVSLFLAMIITAFPRTIVGYRTDKNNGISFKNFLLKKLKIPLIATVFLIVLLLVFSFIILKSEESYYSGLGITPPSSSPTNFWQAIWFCFITISTVGYGQIIPQSPPARIIVIFLILIGTSYYSFYGIFAISIYTSFIQRKQLEEESKKQAVLEEQKQNALATKIKDQLISELIKYNVINEQKYEIIQKENDTLQKRLMQEIFDDAKNTAYNLTIYDFTNLFNRILFWFKKNNLIEAKKLSTYAFVSQASKNQVYLQQAWQSNDGLGLNQTIITVFNKPLLDSLYMNSVEVWVDKIGADNIDVNRLIIYLREPFAKCYGELQLNHYDILSPEETWTKYKDKLSFVSKQDFMNIFGQRQSVYVYSIAKKIIYINKIKIKGIRADESRKKYYILTKF